ncbi:MAG: hypothetical protein ACI9MC_001451, partial [Kiritimatiellia bacterium]
MPPTFLKSPPLATRILAALRTLPFLVPLAVSL